MLLIYPIENPSATKNHCNPIYDDVRCRRADLEESSNSARKNKIATSEKRRCRKQGDPITWDDLELFMIILRMHLGQVLIPLHRQQLLFLDVALLAAGDDVAPGGASAACHRNDMVHGQISGRGRAPTVMADPPLRNGVSTTDWPGVRGLFAALFGFGLHPDHRQRASGTWSITEPVQGPGVSGPVFLNPDKEF